MQLGRLEERRPRPITDHGSTGATVTPLARSATVSTVRIELEAGGLLGMHVAPVGQLFLVVEGSGWTRTPDTPAQPIEVGTVVYWSPGELHETGTETGLAAIIVEGEGLTEVI
jgi:quercetin dioxygenase-like cupin family protein